MHSDLNNPTGSSSDELDSSGRLNDLSSTDSSSHELPTRLNKRLELALQWEADLLFLSEEEFDDAIIGVCQRIGNETVVAYDATKIVEILSRSMSEDEAYEYFEFNILGAYVGERTPAFITFTFKL